MTATLAMTPNDDGSDLRKLTDVELLAMLKSGLLMTVSGLYKTATALRELDRRGIEAPGVKSWMVGYLRQIADGQLLPEVVVRFLGKPGLINIVSRLPKEKQQEIADGKPVELAVHGNDGTITHILAKPDEMRPAQVRQAFGAGYIRPASEQVLFLKNELAESKKKPPKIGEAVLDYELKSAKFGKKVVSLDELKEIVRLLSK